MMASRENRRSGELSGWVAAYENDPAVIYALDRDLKIIRCNRAWDLFAIENGGSQLTRDRMTGFPLMNVIPAVLREFYQTAFESVLRDGTEWWHVYECSSAEVFRQFQMRVLSGHTGLLLINSLVTEHPHESEQYPVRETYFGQHGIAVMCCHCRRTQRADDRSRWDWVPALVEAPPAAISHGLCKVCMAYYYPLVREQI
jgi:hypothetical protein